MCNCKEKLRVGGDGLCWSLKEQLPDRTGSDKEWWGHQQAYAQEGQTLKRDKVLWKVKLHSPLCGYA